MGKVTFWIHSQEKWLGSSSHGFLSSPAWTTWHNREKKKKPRKILLPIYSGVSLHTCWIWWEKRLSVPRSELLLPARTRRYSGSGEIPQKAWNPISFPSGLILSSLHCSLRRWMAHHPPPPPPPSSPSLLLCSVLLPVSAWEGEIAEGRMKTKNKYTRNATPGGNLWFPRVEQKTSWYRVSL